MLTPADVALHERLGITAAMLTRADVRRVTDTEARDLLALNGRTGRLDGIVYPYIDPERQRIVTHRLRRDYPEFEQGKPKNKYLSAWGDRRHLYFGCADAALLTDPGALVIPVEAEKSVLAVQGAADAVQRSVLVIGLGGCWGWRGRIGKVDTPNGGRTDELGPLPDLDRIVWTNRDVVIVFDANAATNPKVQAARRAFSADLTQRGARVRILNLAPEDGINGPDDFIGRHGADRFFAAVDAAPDAVTVDVIFRLNRRHAVVSEGGKTLVVTDQYDPGLQRQVLIRSTFADFRNRYLAESVVVGMHKKTGEPIRQALGHAWLKHPDRRQYDGVCMVPNADVPGYLNLWRGFAVAPQAGCCAKFKAHLYDVICSGNAALFDYVYAWMADAVQHPERSGYTALVFRGGRGTGKSIAVRTFGELFGQHYLHIANTKHLVGNFNAHLQDSIVLFADEAFWAGDKAGESVLKMLITEPVIPIERKGHDVVLVKNLLHILLASNQEWVIPAGVDERRFAVLDVDAGHQNDHAYFAALQQELDDGGRAALLYDLLQHPLDAVNLRDAPATEALREQKILSLNPNERWLFDKLMTGRLLPDHDGWTGSVSKDALHGDYIQTLQKIGVDRRRTETELAIFIRKVLGKAVRSAKRLGSDGKRHAFWTANLQDCQTAFDTATKSRHPWKQADDDQQDDER